MTRQYVDPRNAAGSSSETALSPNYFFTVGMTQLELESLARGDVPANIQNKAISLLIDVRATPGEAIDAMARRRKQR